MERVWLLDESGTPVPASNPLNKYSTVRKGLEMQQISPGTMFGETVAKKTGRKILQVVNALGGSNIRSWMKDSPAIKDKCSIGYDTLQLYSEAVRRAQQAMKYGTLRGILWHQGESNFGNPQEYRIYLKRLAADLRKVLGVPVIDGVIPAVKFAEALVSMGWSTCKTNSWNYPEIKKYFGYQNI